MGADDSDQSAETSMVGQRRTQPLPIDIDKNTKRNKKGKAHFPQMQLTQSVEKSTKKDRQQSCEG